MGFCYKYNKRHVQPIPTFQLEREIEAFNQLEAEFNKKFSLIKPDYTKDFYLSIEVDEINHVINGCLTQKENDDEDVICFISKCLKDHQKNYTCIEKTILGLHVCLQNL